LSFSREGQKRTEGEERVLRSGRDRRVLLVKERDHQVQEDVVRVSVARVDLLVQSAEDDLLVKKVAVVEAASAADLLAQSAEEDRPALLSVEDDLLVKAEAQFVEEDLVKAEAQFAEDDPLVKAEARFVEDDLLVRVLFVKEQDFILMIVVLEADLTLTVHK
jgi:hypothetical protein